MKIYIVKYTLALIMLTYSCKNDKQKTNHSGLIKTQRQEGQKRIQLLYNKISEDSVEVRVEYTSTLDTVDLSNKNERFCFLFWTRENISNDEMEDIIENDDKVGMKKYKIIGYNFGGKKSVVFKYRFFHEEKNYITVTVNDVVFIRDLDVDSTRIIQKMSTLKEMIIVP